MRTLRQRIRKVKIKCSPWRFYKREIQALCISGQCLFSKNGLPWDILEIELKDEGWLLHDESLWEILTSEQSLRRTLNFNCDDQDPFDETWTEEDYKYFYDNL